MGEKIYWLSPSFLTSGCKYEYKNLFRPEGQAQFTGTFIHAFLLRKLALRGVDPAEIHLAVAKEMAADAARLKLNLPTLPEVIPHWEKWTKSEVGQWLIENWTSLLLWEGAAKDNQAIWKTIHPDNPKKFAHIILGKGIGLRLDPDLVFDRGGMLNVLDLKSGFTEGDLLQLKCYALACLHLFPAFRGGIVKVGFFYSKTSGEAKPEYLDSDELLGPFTEYLIKVGTELAAVDKKALPRTAHRYCSNCLEITSCPVHSEIKLAKPSVISQQVTSPAKFFEVYQALQAGKETLKLAQDIASAAQEGLYAFLQAQPEQKVTIDGRDYRFNEYPAKWDYKGESVIAIADKAGLDPFEALNIGGVKIPADIARSFYQALVKAKIDPWQFLAFKKDHLEELLRKIGRKAEDMEKRKDLEKAWNSKDVRVAARKNREIEVKDSVKTVETTATAAAGPADLPKSDAPATTSTPFAPFPDFPATQPATPEGDRKGNVKSVHGAPGGIQAFHLSSFSRQNDDTQTSGAALRAEIKSEFGESDRTQKTIPGAISHLEAIQTSLRYAADEFSEKGGMSYVVKLDEAEIMATIRRYQWIDETLWPLSIEKLREALATFEEAITYQEAAKVPATKPEAPGNAQVPYRLKSTEDKAEHFRQGMEAIQRAAAVYPGGMNEFLKRTASEIIQLAEKQETPGFKIDFELGLELMAKIRSIHEAGGYTPPAVPDSAFATAAPPEPISPPENQTSSTVNFKDTPGYEDGKAKSLDAIARMRRGEAATILGRGSWVQATKAIAGSNKEVKELTEKEKLLIILLVDKNMATLSPKLRYDADFAFFGQVVGLTKEEIDQRLGVAPIGKKNQPAAPWDGKNQFTEPLDLNPANLTGKAQA